MKRELIFGIVVLIVIAAVVITAVGVRTWYANPRTPGGYPCPGCGLMGPGMMGPGTMGPGMMSCAMGMMAVYSPDAKPISESDARARAQLYAGRYGPGVTIGDLMEFSLNYYVVLEDGTGKSIAEILVDRYTGAVSPEPGPNMMWNTGSSTGQRTTAVKRYGIDAGKILAETFLVSYLPGATIQESTVFPGYYTFDFGRGGTEGMLSVNAYTGDVLVHTWHGQYIAG